MKFPVAASLVAMLRAVQGQEGSAITRLRVDGRQRVVAVLRQCGAGPAVLLDAAAGEGGVPHGMICTPAHGFGGCLKKEDR